MRRNHFVFFVLVVLPIFGMAMYVRHSDLATKSTAAEAEVSVSSGNPIDMQPEMSIVFARFPGEPTDAQIETQKKQAISRAGGGFLAKYSEGATATYERVPLAFHSQAKEVHVRYTVTFQKK